MALLYTDEQKDICSIIDSFMKKELLPNLKELDEKGEFPDEIYKKGAELGFNSFEFPEEYGGMGVDYETAGVMYERFGYYDSGFALTMVTTNLAWKMVLLGGTDEQKKLFVDKVLETGYASFALTESGGGSDVSATRTKARRDGDEYVITGNKCFITNGAYAGVFIVVAATDKEKGHKGLTAFIVPADTPGISIGKEENKMGIRTTCTNEIIFDEVRVPAANRLGKEGEGFALAMKTLDLSRPFIGSIATGMAQRALDEAVKYSKERVVFGKTISKFQAIQFILADMDIRVETCRQMYRHAIDLITKGLPFTKEAAIAKCYCTDNLERVASDAVQVLGGYGYMKDYPVEKILRDSKIFQIFEGTNQIQHIVISGQLLK